MSWLYLVLALVAAQRLGELVLSRRNEARLRRQGGHEVGARHYPLFFAVHGGWLLALALVVPAATVPNPIWLTLFVQLQLARVWVIVSLGGRWTTRIIVLPERPLVRRGPYRWLRHPNYWVVVGEIAVLPLAFDAWPLAIAFSLANGLLLWHRIRIEDAALRAVPPAA